MGGGLRDQQPSQTGGTPMLSEINVTPFVDVMLVLLIIFMISAPLLQQGIQVDLPKTKSPALSDQESQVVLVVKRDGGVEINKNSVPLDQLQLKLKAIYANRQKKEIYVQADRAAAYGAVATVMSLIQGAGVSKIGLVTEPKTTP